ncbi:Calmodulin-binding protein 60 A [Abeliophyllum distichum]|uniref:Calmodulin-binding protein 60 A n=1 Tax=Abeliophyllum distichum TaxID=126358 RepID=A0ABD1PN11_9LAMI
MSQKRQQEGTSIDDTRPRKSPSFKSVVLEVMNLRRLQHIMEPVLEPLIRRVVSLMDSSVSLQVKEEVDSALKKYLISMNRNCGKDLHPSESRSLQLCFSNAISLPVFTGSRIEGEECSNLKVALVDDLTGQVVSSGPECSAKVEIIVLEGDFDGDEGGNWKIEEFKNNVVRERGGRKPLLSGDTILTLRYGEGSVGDILFTDNSSWTRSRKFRLGARVMDNFDGIRIREAKSESFVVRDHRGELYKKHYPPSLSDEIWRLEKIGKDGAFHKRLRKERVNTVRDFLILLFLDPARLRNILGTGMSAKMWAVTVEHARTCVLDKKLYLYNASGSQQMNGVVFNVVGQVLGQFLGSQYVAADKLSEAEKADARNLIISAYRDWEKVITFDDEPSLMDALTCSSNFLSSSNLLPDGSFDGHKVLSSCKIDRRAQNPSSPDITQSLYSIGGLSSLDDYFHGFDQPSGFPGEVANTLTCDADSLTHALSANEHLPYLNTGSSLQSSIIEPSNDLQSAASHFVSHSAIPVDKAQRRWTLLFSVLKWFQIFRIVVKKTGVRKIS